MLLISKYLNINGWAIKLSPAHPVHKPDHLLEYQLWEDLQQWACSNFSSLVYKGQETITIGRLRDRI